MNSGSSKLKTWLVFGEALVDKFPQASVTGGAPYNVARHLAGFGAHVIFISRIGADANGAAIQSEMQQLGMATQSLQIDAVHPTGTVRVTQAANGSHEFHILSNQAYDYIDASSFDTLLTDLGDEAQLYHGTLALRSATSRSTWKALCAREPKLRFVDMNWRENHLTHEAALGALQGACLLKLSESELALVTSWLSLDTPWLKQAPSLDEHCAGIASLMRQLQVGTLLVTYGQEGSAVCVDGACIAAAQSAPVANLVDTVGAGDAFSAVCMLAQNESWDWPTTLKRASEFAAAICGIRGAAPANIDFYKHWRQQWQLDKA